MRILLTGGGGFIGQRLIPLLQERRHDVMCLLRDNAPCPPGAEPIRADLARDQHIKAPGAIDAVIHLAQSSRYRDFPAGADDIFSVNTASTARLLDLARRAGARSFVLASTGSVYGTQGGPCREDRFLAPADFYAASKLAAETLLQPYAGLFRVCALRLFAPYGPSQFGRLIPTLAQRVRDGHPISLDGEADGLRFAAAYVDDVAAILLAAAEQGWEGVYNAAAPEPTSVRETAALIGDLIGVEPIFQRTGRPEPVSLIPDLDRLSRLYDLHRLRSLREGLALMLRSPAIVGISQ